MDAKGTPAVHQLQMLAGFNVPHSHSCVFASRKKYLVFYTETNPKEQMTVGVAQNCTAESTPTAFSVKDTQGRSWHDGAKDTRPGAINLGLNFA